MKKKSASEKGLPEIEKIVRAMLKEKHITHRKLASMVGWHNSTVTLLLKRRIWSITELLEVGKALGEDLLKLYYPVPSVPPVPQVPVTELEAAQKEVANLKAEMKTKDEELLKLRTENELLRQVVFAKQA